MSRKALLLWRILAEMEETEHMTKEAVEHDINMLQKILIVGKLQPIEGLV